MSVTENPNVTQEENCNTNGGAFADPRIAFFDHHAPGWDDDADDVALTLKRLGGLKDRLGLRAGEDVLEAGCGTGRITGWLAGMVQPGRVVAADFSPAMLVQARARGVPAEFRLMDICVENPCGDRFDTILCFNSFPHFRDQRAALRQIRRLLKPSGRLIILHLAGSAELNAYHSELAHPVCHDLMPSSDAWPGLLSGCGLALLNFTDEPDLYLLVARVAG
jgi:SAM-dependent methyltransferase